MATGKTISVSGAGGRYAREERRMRAIRKKLSGMSGMKSTGFETHLVSNREMRALNRKFLGKDQPTNVLSFSAAAGFVNPAFGKNTRYLGEVFLAPDWIRVRRENIDRLLIHGLCHLLGYTHDRKRDRMKMEKLEDKLSKALNI